MKWLEDIAKRHDEWIRMVHAMGETTNAEDIVQDMYIKLTKFKDEREYPQTYIWLTLRSILCDTERIGARIRTQPLEDLELPYIDNEEDEGYKAFIERLNAEIKTWHDHEQRLYRLYVGTYKGVPSFGKGMSIRQLQSETKLSFMHIVYTLKRCKDKIRENLGEDWTDYLNEDYELL